MIYRFGGCELDTQRITLSRASQTIRLRPKVFQLLEYLLVHHERVVSKDELCTAIWPDQFIHDTTLGSTVRAARSAVGDTGHIPSDLVVRRFNAAPIT
ncbi:winged helix-turn-helix domain-containing protein, partial [Candidatus Entotheonella palauensis]|uniref:winged helix-turn-helix domain-containing protein n=1 Tax=Candidatus Entotheonella palauensis TaxID=93172 RepID=UPI0015C48593